MNNFRHENINDHIIRIIDHFGVAMYLVMGGKCACLIDTGYGYKGLRDYVKSLSPLPLFVVLSHGHVDHAFGIYEFNDLDIYMNHEDLETYKMHSDLKYRENFMKNFSPDLDMNDFQQETPIDFKPITDGQIFDLGGIHIQAIHVPGHTKGMMMFLFKEDRIMMYGDACGVETMIMEDCSANLSDYLKSLYKVKKIESEYDSIIRNHGTFVSSKAILDEVVQVTNEVLEGKDDHILLPEFMQTMFPRKTDKLYPCYSAKQTDKHGRIDGKEGNINYRIDKVK